MIISHSFLFCTNTKYNKKMINGDKMNNAELIITLTLIKGLGRKTINKIIRQVVLNSLETI